MNQFFGHKTEGSALSMRRRSVWEAADAGVLLWKNNFFYFIPFFAIPVWAAACALRLLPNNLIWLSYLLLWWLKPLFDRLVLHVVSRRFFDASGSGSIKDLSRGLAGTLFCSLLGDLLWRRFSLGRSSRMPVRILERINRKQYVQRKETLAYGGLNFCFLISILGFFLEALLLMGEIIFVIIVARIIHPSLLGYMQENMGLMEVFIFAAFSLNYIIVESLYVCMGFGLYINSRVEVEGWDLQLQFQKFAGEKQPSSAQGAKTAVIICLLFAGLLLPMQVQAEQNGSVKPETAAEETLPAEFFPPDFPFAPEESIDSLNEILASPDFGYKKEGWTVKYKYSKEPRETPDFELSPWLERLRIFFGSILRLVVVLVIAAFISFAVYWIWKFQREGRFRRFGKYANKNMYQNPLVSPENPELLFSRAEDFFRKGLLREAWAACLSACLGSYAEYHLIFFPADATEYGCLSLLRQARPGGEEHFGSLVQNWISFAYGGRVPAEGSFEEAVAFGRSIKNLRLAEAAGEP